jgi:hypothetical protein
MTTKDFKLLQNSVQQMALTAQPATPQISRTVSMELCPTESHLSYKRLSDMTNSTLTQKEITT